MLRSDIAKAIGELPPPIRDQVTGACAPCLELVNAHLAEDELVSQLASAATSWLNAPINSLLVLTSHRLIFVAPAPQVVGWKLTALTKVLALNGKPGRVAGFHVHADGGEFQLGIDGGWGQVFERSVKQATALAVLANR
jgi:hypothetical protein